jgi:hypothetical protein
MRSRLPAKDQPNLIIVFFSHFLFDKDGGWSPSIDKKPFMNSMEPNDLRQMK